MTSNNSSVSWGVSTAVGSSKIKMFAFLYKVFRISVLCWIPTEASIILSFGSTSNPYFFAIFETSEFNSSQSIIPLEFLGSLPNPMFSAAVKDGTKWNSWWTMPMPSSIALSTLFISTGLSFINISPESGCSIPYKIFTRVDFPAPFSPTRACISPFKTLKSTESLAVTPG